MVGGFVKIGEVEENVGFYGGEEGELCDFSSFIEEF